MSLFSRAIAADASPRMHLLAAQAAFHYVKVALCSDQRPAVITVR